MQWISESCNTMEIEAALSALLAEVTPVPEGEQVSLCHAVGRVLSADVRAPFAVPHFPKSAMDGYAVRAEDVRDATPERPVRLKVVGELLAGDDPAFIRRDPSACYGRDPSASRSQDDRISCHSEPKAKRERSEGEESRDFGGTAVRIMTGAPVPEGYDAVVKQEDTDYGETEVSVYRGVTAYTNYCRVGEDIPEGSLVLRKGRRIGRIEAGVLASLGISEVSVVRPIRVSVISTGSELCSLGENGQEKAPPVGRIYNSIAVTISSSLPGTDFCVSREICPDDADRIASALEEALKISDVVITTGGVSVGKRDLLPEVLSRIGAKRIFSGVDIQPGTPTIGSVKDGKVILSLSGNPYAALVNYDLYFWEVAAKLTGCSAYLPISEEAVLGSEYTKINKHRRLLRAKVCGGQVTLPAKSHASSVQSNLLDCNCYIDIPAGQEVAPGDRVKIIRMPLV